MKAITLHQPWASLVALGKKKIETRSWATNHRGVLAIHAAKYYPNDRRSLTHTYPFADCLRGAIPCHQRLGVVVWTCTLIDCVKMTPEFIDTIEEPERSFGWYKPGRYAWVLRDIYQLKNPIEARGQQGLWDFTPPILELINI